MVYVDVRFFVVSLFFFFTGEVCGRVVEADQAIKVVTRLNRSYGQELSRHTKVLLKSISRPPEGCITFKCFHEYLNIYYHHITNFVCVCVGGSKMQLVQQ